MVRTPGAPWARAAFVGLVALAILLLGARAAVTIRDADVSDFRCLYEAGRLVRLGEDPYDRAAWTAAIASDPARLPPCNEAFVYPLWTAVLASPATLVPLATAVAGWEALTLLSVVASVALLARALGRPRIGAALLVLTLWSQPAFSLVANAQLGGVVLLALAALSLALARDRAVPAAVAWLALLLKPHVTLVPLAGALATSRRLLVLALGGLALLLAATLAILPAWPAELARELVPQGRLADPGVDTLWGLAAALGIAPGWAVAASVLLVASIAGTLPRRRLARAELVALLVPIGLVITPYARAHDQVALAAAWAVALAAGVEHRDRRLVVATAAVAVVLSWVLTALTLAGLPLGARMLVPYASGLLAAYALRRRALP